jgi:hypothetical protein
MTGFLPRVLACLLFLIAARIGLNGRLAVVS